MYHVQKPIRLGDTLLYRNQNPSKKRFRFGFRDCKDARMTGCNQQYRADKGGVWPFGIVRIKERSVKGGRVYDEAPLVLKRKPYVEASNRR